MWLVLGSLLSGGVVCAAAPATTPALDARWSHFASPNFELYSRASARESRDVLEHLETLRAVLMDRFKMVEKAKLEVTVYLFRSQADFAAYVPAQFGKGSQLQGFYQAYPDRAVICLAPAGGRQDVQRMVFHEYVHHMFASAEADPPAWYNEGIAELMASMEKKGGMLEIGHPHPERLAYLQESGYLPLETLFAADYDSPYYSSWEHVGGFYAQSWALVHFWYCGDAELPKGAAMKFLQVAADRKKAATTDLRAHFRACFGMDYPQMLRLLEEYIQKGSYRYLRQPPPKIDPPASYPTRTVSLEEMRLRLTELSLRVHHSAMANFTLVDAVAQGLKDARILEALGTFALLEQDPARASERWEQALAAGSTNSAVQREAARWTIHGWLTGFSASFRLASERAEQLRARLLKAIEQEPRQTAAYESLAWVEAVAETPSAANVTLVQEKLPTLRQKYRTIFALALINLRAGRTDEATAQLASLNGVEVDPVAEQAVETVRAKLEGRPAKLILGIPQAK